MYIDEINTFEIRKKANTIKSRPIYEVIDENYFIGCKLFTDDVCRNVRIIEMNLDLFHYR